jgi:hypothetical protein
MRVQSGMGVILSLFSIALAGCSIVSVPSSSSATATPASPEERTWAQLEQRPIQVPRLAAGATCPITPYQAVPPPPNAGPDSLDLTGRGDGPVYLEVEGVSGVLIYDRPSVWRRQEWGGGNAQFAEHAPNNNFVLVRGHPLDGSNKLRIGEGYLPPLEYRMDPTPWATQTGWTGACVYPRVRVPGCYAFQVHGVNQTDGTSFSYLIVFQATPAAQ